MRARRAENPKELQEITARIERLRSSFAPTACLQRRCVSRRSNAFWIHRRFAA